MPEFTTSVNTSKGKEFELAIKIYAQLRTGEIITGKELKTRLKTDNSVLFSHAIDLLGEILCSAGYELKVSDYEKDRRVKCYQLSAIAPIDYILYMRNIGAKIFANNDYILNNSGLIPIIFDHIINKSVIKFCYSPFDRDNFYVTLHPHIIKEYNGRWFLFGFTFNKISERMQISNFALDRITSEIKIVDRFNYMPPEMDTYYEYFKDIIGVSNPSHEAEDIFLRTNSAKGHGYVVTKKIHASLEEVLPYDKDLGYGRIKLHVKRNRELINYLLSMGEHITIESPDTLRNEYLELLKKMIGYYHSK